MASKQYMTLAIKQARIALSNGDVPVGAVIVKDGRIISRGYNKKEKSQNAIKHAEIIAIERACKKLKSWRLDGCDLYVTLEPCPMCAGAILNARMRNLIYAADDVKSGFAFSKFNIFDKNILNHKTNVIKSEMAEYCSNMLREFFRSKRN